MAAVSLAVTSVRPRRAPPPRPAEPPRARAPPGHKQDFDPVLGAQPPWERAGLDWNVGIGFGGPAGQIAVMHRILVEEKNWISESRFLHALNYCMLLPGPEAQQLATYIGWLLHRTAGGIMAGGLFILPGVLSIMALSYVYAGWGNVPIIAALFFGLGQGSGTVNLLAASAALQLSARLLPIGETQPRPVMTTRRIMAALPRILM